MSTKKTVRGRVRTAKTMKPKGNGSKRQKRDHDDPIVADNGTVEFDFKRPPQDLSDGRVWARSYTVFDYLAPFFDGIPQPPQGVQGISSLTFVYAKPNGNPKDEELVLTSTGKSTVILEVKIDQLKHKSVFNKRFLVPAKLKGLRLKTLSGYDADGKAFNFELFNGQEPKYDSVKFTIEAQRERR